MEPKFKIFFVLSLFFAYSEQIYSQGIIDGFYKQQKEASLVLGYGFANNSDYLIGREASNLNRKLSYTSLFTSYGITDQLNIQVSLPYIESETNMDFQDLSLFSKYKVYSKQNENNRIELSLALGFSTPLSNYAIGGLYDIGQQASIIDTRAMLHYQLKSNWFTTIQSGFSYKLQEVPNSIPAVIKLGRATKSWYYDLYYEMQHSLGGIDYRGTPRPQNFRELRVNFQKVDATLYKPIYEELGAFGSFAYVLDGRNTFQGPSYGFGLVYAFKH
ncbi:hypothetical protein ESY86_17260 [Subsaximicrobium wynnwilliamsii]|uniref:Uncharacterized protein n=1 Tax=Subsaximicrobium wynnwilliamsii TaxID=291179 RepID=A0A5C6ZC00_9FLAO|nr:transporter [Subsaximicrobium wynnwilliamsii]TXD81320.1 hypothetical protein ESY87_18705 [Subsaximicrobium wynnwilliamsii]TXD87311.1 hypothetical protein ESY86_17260 [Subsaximicrobium wynnwilliamsii]TXE00916.1 hypothetical protein ESY88_17765 [Subsaximicrobium wynnwilliamsii]